jgi:hypothetical protein
VVWRSLPAFKAPPRPSNTSTASNTGPADFPKIEADVQKQRDELGRRPILERELRDREERCNLIRKEYNNAAPVKLTAEETSQYQQRVANLKTQAERCDADLLAIRRELSALK